MTDDMLNLWSCAVFVLGNNVEVVALQEGSGQYSLSMGALCSEH